MLAVAVVFVDEEFELTAVFITTSQIFFSPGKQVGFKMTVVGVELEVGITSAFGMDGGDEFTRFSFPELYVFGPVPELLGMVVVEAAAFPAADFPVEAEGGDGVGLDEQVADAPVILVIG